MPDTPLPYVLLGLSALSALESLHCLASRLLGSAAVYVALAVPLLAVAYVTAAHTL
jgi:hypothetical protein